MLRHKESLLSVDTIDKAFQALLTKHTLFDELLPSHLNDKSYFEKVLRSQKSFVESFTDEIFIKSCLQKRVSQINFMERIVLGITKWIQRLFGITENSSTKIIVSSEYFNNDFSDIFEEEYDLDNSLI